MLSPISFENEHLIIHPFRPQEMDRLAELSNDVFEILSDELTLKFIPKKRLESIPQAEGFLKSRLLSHYSGKNFFHFITRKSAQKVIGIIELISPDLAMEHYQLKTYPYFIEFYLSSSATGCYIMTELLPVVIECLSDQGISHIGAVVHRKNTAATKVLKNAKFTYQGQFDIFQDFYEINPSAMQLNPQDNQA
ncbi:hypothetical protein CA265_12035 [Sphingobacteriaceae bacterium GW460-11-11-14-LB5]|nr:hypothetical protein CA265_12035 [Sphingobacteriaceae bacterium GW460-11-11-14-LB5]